MPWGGITGGGGGVPVDAESPERVPISQEQGSNKESGGDKGQKERKFVCYYKVCVFPSLDMI